MEARRQWTPIVVFKDWVERGKIRVITVSVSSMRSGGRALQVNRTGQDRTGQG
jgi:hypothetical protein